MEYQDIVNSYKKNGLDISSLKKGLEIAKPLSGRSRYRAVRLSGENTHFYMRTLDIVRKPAESAHVEYVEREVERELDKYFTRIVQSMRDCRAWKITGLVAQNYTPEKFKELSVPKRFEMVRELNQKYSRFLEIQKIADLRDCVFSFKKLSEDEDKLKKLCFLKLMFKAFKNEDIIREFYIFDKAFLNALVDYRKNKKSKENLETFMSKKRASTFRDYQKYSKFFSQEDFRELAENIQTAAQTLRITTSSVIEAYSEMSETEAEKVYLSSELKILESLEEKYNEMMEVKKVVEKEQKEKEKEDRLAKEKAEKLKKLEEERIRKQKEAAERIKQRELAERNRIIGKTEGSTGMMAAKIKDIQETPTAKEQVNPLIFAWFDKEEMTLTKKIGTKRLTEFFEKIKRVEAETGVRVSLYLITNAGKEETVRRVEELQKKARVAGLSRLVEGALGGYSSFRVDSDKNVTDLAKMSPENRKKITTLLNRAFDFPLPPELILPEEVNYLRYQFTDKRDKSIDKRYLNFAVNRLLSDQRVSKQPLKFLPYIENRKAGIDVVLESQLRGISQLPEYYKSKYYVAPGKTMKVSIEEIDLFLNPEASKDGEEHE